MKEAGHRVHFYEVLEQAALDNGVRSQDVDRSPMDISTVSIHFSFYLLVISGHMNDHMKTTFLSLPCSYRW